MYKKCKCLLLPINEKAEDCFVLRFYKELSFRKGYWTQEYLKSIDGVAQHLYILSNEEIKEGDWFINRQYFIEKDNKPEYEIWQCDKNFINSDDCKKIIATTDSNLGKSKKEYEDDFGLKVEETSYFPLPSISQSFIDIYVSEYNKGINIEEVMVEFNTNWSRNTTRNVPTNDDFDEIFVVNPDNTINIQFIKDSWTREEVIELCKQARKSAGEINIDEWIESHLYKMQ